MNYYPKRVPKNSQWLIKDVLSEAEFLVGNHSNLLRKFLTYQFRPLDVWHWEWGKWVLITQYRPAELCECGKEYNKFMFKEQKSIGAASAEVVIDILQRPYLCKECYYRTEWLKKRWVPKDLRMLFENE